MAAKLLHTLADDNPDLKKQIGCMTGIFQLFDRQQMITAKRITGHSPKKLPPSGNAHLNSGGSQQEPSSVPTRFGTAENQMSKSVHDKHKFSTESSRPSFSSSSRSSSFSSLDCNKVPQPESSSYDRIIFPDTPPKEQVICLPNESYKFDQQHSFDLRDVVKDSINKETQGLSGKVATKPAHLLNTDDVYCGLRPGGNQESSIDLNESLRVLAKIRDTPHYFSEPRELSRSSSYNARDGPSFLIPKDAPRFSYDGREANPSSVAPRDSFKSYLKHKELPRLSLDGREGSMRNLNSDSRSSSNLKNFQKENSSPSDHVNNLNKAPGIQSRPPSVVAKLMGLEMMPESASASEDKLGLSRTYPAEDAPSLSRPPEASDLYQPIRSSSSSRNLWREPNSPRRKNSDSVMKPISRFPIEPAPWKQLDGNRGAQKPAQKNVKSSSKRSGAIPSVYGEIEKRLKDIEFSSSGKDLRALKQILEAMQEKVLLEGNEEGQDQNYSTRADHERIFRNSVQSARLANERKPQVGQVTTSQRKGSSAYRNFESPIVIMKPAKLIDKSGVPSSSIIPLHSIPSLPALQCGDSTNSRSFKVHGRTTKDQISKTNHGGEGSMNPNDVKLNKKISNSTHSSVRSQQPPKEGTAISMKSSGSISPRTQHKKPELEKISRPPTPPSDSNRSRKQSGRQQKESNSPGGRSRSKYSNTRGGDLMTDLISESRDLSSHHSGSHAEVNENSMLDSRVVTEVGASEITPERSIDKTPTQSGGKNLIANFAGKKSLAVLSEDESVVEVTTDAPEYPSPISVLDSAAYDDDSLSPVKQQVKTVIGEKPLGSDRLLSTGKLSSAVETREKLQNIENLVQKLRRLNSNHDEASTDYIASLCENTNPDDRYISEVLLASGLLLRDLGSSLTTLQFHSSGNPINPELFLVLEQTKASRLTKECSTKVVMKEKFHRKLIFDSVNEILAQKLFAARTSAEPWLRPHKLAKKTLNAQKLLRELCSEVEQLQTKRPEYRSEDEDDADDDVLKIILWEDVMNRSDGWTAFKSETSGIVLDVERSIFKDLVDEVVIGESAGLKIRPVRRRQLFGK
ncbi:hypothetical protein LIER_12712 [Lithospermum erythrorhizon]|uniref:DUF4378 domain-containing protein n=1 Tax=Lithospermum erythrorhizon TaxID=34254 RepID=A0AAV3PST8_LITER